MGVTKTEIFTDEQNRIAQMAKVIGHPARVAILQHLLAQRSCICGDLVNIIGLSQPTISQHLREMKRVGLIKGNIEGTSVCYCIDSEVFKKYERTFSTLFDIDQCKLDNCC
ncbi:MAG: metalloregulator ArsR/SmtB family transcription factor [Saprospiraceae bacterium]|nr:metalloregulator ArsR/SmtB family transcription factor [Saprospiraceae bacterium]